MKTQPAYPTDETLLSIIQSLTLYEKSILCSGLTAWRTKPIPEKGIPPLDMADGPHGVRVEDFANRKHNDGHSKKATCFPPQVTQASSWDPELTREIGEAIAEECLHYGVGLLLGPGVNVKRNPLCGRNFEYYAEDPLLSGELAAGFIQGVQAKGVGTSIKHYAVNNQESRRMSIDALVDDRALFDIYLKAFEIAIREAQPDTVMASYNRINGHYATQNRRLLFDILRMRFGFSGAVISDWGAVYQRPAALQAGLDLEMPASGGVNDYAIRQAVEQGHLPEDTLDTACWNLLRLILRRSRHNKPHSHCNWQAHHQLATKALVKGAVLLKNNGILPLKDEGRIAVIGEMAEKPRYQGGGSSVINPQKLVSFLSAMKAAGKKFVYTPGYNGTHTNETMIAAAVAAAKASHTVLLFLGLPDSYECEGYDREHLRLPQSQLMLLQAVAAANPNVCVVLGCGAPVEAPWLDKASALLCLYLGGQAIGEAALRLLYGQDNPSGKLAESWPMALEDNPTTRHFPMGPNEVTYNESIFVGYRYYATAQKTVLFPFGYGLSYTQYAYSGFKLSSKNVKVGQPQQVTFTVTNTGTMDGEEIAQLYLSRKNSATFQPARELVGYQRIALAAGESKEITLTLPYQNLGFYHTPNAAHVVEAGSYQLLAGPNCNELPLTADFKVQGVTLAPDTEGKEYMLITEDHPFSHSAFSTIYKGSIQGNRPPKKGEYTDITTLGDMDESLVAKFILAIAGVVARYTVHFSTDAEANRKAARQMTRDLPFKNLVLNTSGHLSPRAAAALLSLCNGTGGLLRLLKELAAKKPYKP